MTTPSSTTAVAGGTSHAAQPLRVPPFPSSGCPSNSLPTGHAGGLRPCGKWPAGGVPGHKKGRSGGTPRAAGEVTIRQETDE